jgi:hypothetical protein
MTSASKVPMMAPMMAPVFDLEEAEDAVAPLLLLLPPGLLPAPGTAEDWESESEGEEGDPVDPMTATPVGVGDVCVLRESNKG